MSKQDRLLSDEELEQTFERIIRNSVKDLAHAYNSGNKGYDWLPTIKAMSEIANTQKRLYAESEKKPLIKMLDTLGVEKCPACSEHLIDDDMNICESCNYGVHEWCTGYTYDGDGEYPAESAYAICKNCYKPDQLRAEQRAKLTSNKNKD